MTDDLQPDPILQSTLRDAPWDSPASSRLPGTGPVADGDWLRLDDAYGEQMALRERLITQRRDKVHALLPQAESAARELLDIVITALRQRPDFTIQGDHVIRPDGARVDIDRAHPLLTLGQLMQQDFCLLQKQGDEHLLTGAILCFPASWTLDEKIGRPLTTIHDPVAPYTDDIARRVQRLFDMVRPETPLWRVNLLLYADHSLFQPRRIAERRTKPSASQAIYVRSERQCISRLPDSGAIVFAIHTTIVRKTEMSPQMQTDLARYLQERA